MTDSLSNIAAALAAAQAEIGGAAKSKVNPHFKSSYADLSEVMDACRAALTKNGIAVVQMPSADGPAVTLRTMLLHKSGEYLDSSLTMTATQNTPQAIGSAITYARRYALAAMVGIAPEDDDGNAATHRQPPAAKVPEVKAPAGFGEWLMDLEAVALEGTKALQEAWQSSSAELRAHLTKTDANKWERIKAKAAAGNGAAA